MSSLSFQNPISKNVAVKPVKFRLGVASYDTPTWAKVLEMAAWAMRDGARKQVALFLGKEGGKG